MSHLLSFNSFNRLPRVDENIQAAKGELLKRYSEKMNVPLSEIPKEEQAEILRNNKDYQAILQMLRGKDGYVYPFVLFRFDHNVRMNQLANLLEKIKQYAAILNTLPMSIEEYAKQDQVNGVDSFEALMDAFDAIETRKRSRWIIDSTPGDLRRRLRMLGDRDQDRLIKAAKMIDDADAKVGTFIDPETGAETNNKISLLKKVKAFADKSAEEYLEWVEEFANGVSSSDIVTKMDQLKDLVPEAGLLYLKNGYMVLGIRTEKAQKDLCSIANWCINRGMWGTYGGKQDSLQINIFDFNKRPTDPLHITGTTVTKDKRVTHSHDKDDRSVVKSNNFKEHLLGLGYPEELASSVDSALVREALIKDIVTGFNMDSSSPRDLLKTIVFASYDDRVNLEEDHSVIDPILEIIDSRVTNSLSPQETQSLFMEKGWLSPFSAILFNLLFPDLSTDFRNRMVTRANEIFKELGEILAYFGASKYPAVTAAIKKKEEILRILETGESIKRNS
jgi:hypothetical protein